MSARPALQRRPVPPPTGSTVALAAAFAVATALVPTVTAPVGPAPLAAQTAPVARPASVELAPSGGRARIQLEGRSVTAFSSAEVVPISRRMRSARGMRATLGRAQRGRRTLTVETTRDATPGRYAVELVSRRGRVRLKLEVTVAAAPSLAALSLSSRTPAEGDRIRGSVTLDAVPSEDVVIALAAQPRGLVELPRNVRIAAGRRGASFSARVGRVERDGTVQVSATLDRTRRSATLSVTAPKVQVELGRLAITTPGTVRGGTVEGAVGFAAPVASDRSVEVFAGPSEHRAEVFTETVLVAAGRSEAAFEVTLPTSFPITSVETVPVTATHTTRAGEEQTATAELVLHPDPDVESIDMDPVNDLMAGEEATVEIGLELPAPPGGAALNLEPSNAAVLADLPGTVTVPEGQTTVSFSFTPQAPVVAPSASAGINVQTPSGAHLLGRSFTVHRPAALDRLNVLTPSPWRYPTTVVIEIELDIDAPRSTPVALSTDRPEVLDLPETVTVAQGDDDVTLSLQTNGPDPGELASVSITAALGDVSAERGPFTAYPPLPWIESLELTGSSRDRLYPGDYVQLRYDLGGSSNPQPAGHQVVQADDHPAVTAEPLTSSNISYGYVRWRVGDFDEPAEVELTTSAGGTSESVTVSLVKPIFQDFRFELGGQPVTEVTAGTSEARALTCVPTFDFPVEVQGPGFEETVTYTSDRPDLIEVVDQIEMRFRAYENSHAISCRVVWGVEVTEPTPVTVSMTYLGETRATTVTVLPEGGEG